jgi:DNA (cytosine-5)-methyltransferase 1
LEERFEEECAVKRKLNIISLFAGAGGLEIAASSTGRVRKIISTDSNTTFLETTKVNMPGHFPDVKHEAISADIRELQGKDLLDLLGAKPDLVMGGPPCDDFTHFGRRMGMGGDKGPLIFEYLRLVSELQPRCFLFENVPNLAQQFRDVFEEFLRQSEILGFSKEWRLLSAANFGAPTMRKRVIAVGWDQCARMDRKDFEFPIPTHGNQSEPDLFGQSLRPYATVSDVLANLPDVKIGEEIKFYNHTGRTHRPKTVEHIKTVPQGVHIKQSYRYRAPWDGLCRSLTAGLDDSTKSYIHPLYHREMSVREYARLQGFPDTWVFQGTHHNGIKQTANAVPIFLGKAILSNILFALCNNK